MPVVVIATIHPRPEHREAVRAAFVDVVPQVHAESGCELYALHEDGDSLVMVEQWTSREHLDAHSRGPALAALNAVVGPLLQGPPSLVLCSPVPAGDGAKGVLVTP